MARIRTIKPEFWQDSRLARLPLLARCVYICLWSMADDEGRIEGDAETVWHFGFPRESVDDVSRALASLRESSRVVPYKGPDGLDYMVLPNWKKHQKIDHPTPSKLPAPPTLTSDSRGFAKIREDSSSPRAGSDLDQGSDQGREGIGSESPPVVSISPPEPGSVADLAARLREPLEACSKAVNELEALGVPPERIRARIEATDPGKAIGIWAWKASVLAGWKADQPKAADHGPRTESSNGARLAKIAAENARAQADLEAFKASGFTSRAEWVARKAQA